MRTRIKVTDLSLGQWDHLQDTLRETYEMPDSAVRVCVEFELDAQMDSRHVEMPVRAFTALLSLLQEVQARAEAALTPDVLPDPAEWSAPLTPVQAVKPKCGCSACRAGSPFWRGDLSARYEDEVDGYTGRLDT